MARYFRNIIDTISTLMTGMGITWKHMIKIRKNNVTLQYPEERWPRPPRQEPLQPVRLLLAVGDLADHGAAGGTRYRDFHYRVVLPLGSGFRWDAPAPT